MPYNILILGAAYGSLLASKMLFGGHKIHHVCLPAEADLINAEGFRVRMPVRGRAEPVVIDSRKLPGKVSAAGTSEVNPADYDLVGLAMQEPQYRRCPTCGASPASTPMRSRPPTPTPACGTPSIRACSPCAAPTRRPCARPTRRSTCCR
jgi:hypothetical protein